MGWSIDIHSNKKIAEKDLDKIIQELPPKLRGPWDELGIPMKKSYGGWHAASDVYKPEGNTFRIGGSYGISGHIAEEFAEYLKIELEKSGHDITLKPNW